MGQSLAKIYIHLVFSTKHRLPLIQPPIEQDLHAYLGGMCKQLGCPVISVGGYQDHIHMLFMLNRKTDLSKVVQKLKTNSSKWIKTKDPSLQHFRWQDGYGAFSVSPRQIEVVANYIRNQHEHHRKRTFQEEFYGFLRRYKIAFDERYVWE